MSQVVRRPIVAANWKMHKVRAEAREFCRTVVGELGAPPAEVVVFPSFPLLDVVADGLAGMPVAIGGQDLHPEPSGPHTGDVAGMQLADAGCTWVLCGHSERRSEHGESDELVGRKALAAVASELTPLICLGEQLEERRAGRTFEVLGRQLEAALAGGPQRFELAYEPVWAIGTGETATPEVAQEAHAFLRAELGRRVGDEGAASTRILYGGSVKPGNAAALIAQRDVDGFLVGGAALDARSFLAIIGACGAS
ncbi:MAG: triose-phosphate isomerase [Acidobacteria bacterium]|nr:MAG: triose-phosphate isomerase [Acidobacteriota bacterium]